MMSRGFSARSRSSCKSGIPGPRTDLWGNQEMHPHLRRLVSLADARLKNRFSASGDRESQGGVVLQLALARLSPAEQVSPRGKSARASSQHRLLPPKNQRESPGNANSA